MKSVDLDRIAPEFIQQDKAVGILSQYFRHISRYSIILSNQTDRPKQTV